VKQVDEGRYFICLQGELVPVDLTISGFRVTLLSLFLCFPLVTSSVIAFKDGIHPPVAINLLLLFAVVSNCCFDLEQQGVIVHFNLCMSVVCGLLCSRLA
jgi:hypothetical protein